MTSTMPSSQSPLNSSILPLSQASASFGSMGRDAANEAAQRLGAEFVQAIGRRFVLYRKAQDPEKRNIVLPK